MVGEGVPIGVIEIGTPGACVCARVRGGRWMDSAYRYARYEDMRRQRLMHGRRRQDGCGAPGEVR